MKNKITKIAFVGIFMLMVSNSANAQFPPFFEWVVKVANYIDTHPIQNNARFQN